MHAGLLDGSLLCRCVVAGAKFPSSAGLVAKIFKPLLLSPPSPAREQALKALSRKLGASENSQPPSDILARTLGSSGVLALVANCLEGSTWTRASGKMCILCSTRRYTRSANSGGYFSPNTAATIANITK